MNPRQLFQVPNFLYLRYVVRYLTAQPSNSVLSKLLTCSILEIGTRKAIVFVGSLYLGLAPEPCRVPPLVSFLFFIYKVTIIIFKFVPSCVCHIFDFVLIFIFFNYSCFAEKRPVLVNHKPSC